MRWYILQTLLTKEVLRHRAERGAIFLVALLVVATLLLSHFGKENPTFGGFTPAIKLCFIDYWRDDGWIQALKERQTTEVKLRFRKAPFNLNAAHLIAYPQSTAAIQILPRNGNDSDRVRYKVVFRYPGVDGAVMGPLSDWLWKETLGHFQDASLEIVTSEDKFAFPPQGGVVEVSAIEGDTSGKERHKLAYRTNPASPGKDTIPLQIEEERAPTHGSADLRSMVATGLIFFALCFFSVYLLPSLMCEERERGVLLAQALSPASPEEILASKFLFYPALGIGLASLLTLLYQPAVLARPFFWLVLLTSSAGYLGIGLTIASAARTQREASMGALCYMLTVALLLFLTQSFGIPSIQYVALEYYGPRMTQAVLSGTVAPWHWISLIANTAIAAVWLVIAAVLFRRHGWQ